MWNKMNEWMLVIIMLNKMKKSTNTKNERITMQRINGMHIIPKPLLV